MKRKFVKVMFLGTLAFSTVAYVGCQDYDDDISNLQTQIDANKASIAELQSLVKSGQWVTAVESITNGFRITFNDGKSYDIVNGTNGTNGVDGTNGTNGTNGVDGADGKDGTIITIDPTTKNWIIDGVDSGICSQGKDGVDGTDGEDGKDGVDGTDGTDGKDGVDGTDGKDGADGHSPYIQDGFWYVWNAETQKMENSEIEASSNIYVTADPNNAMVWLLNVLNHDTKEWETVSIPKAASITSMTAYQLENGTPDLSSEGAEITLYYGVAGSDIKFGADEKNPSTNVKKGAFLPAKGSATFTALINPVLSETDIKPYEGNIYLQDSKGNTNFVISSIEANKSEAALTRAESTVNKGFFNFTINFKNKVVVNDLNDNIAYALATKDGWGKEVISAYDIKVKATSTEPTITFDEIEPLDFQTQYELDAVVGEPLSYMVDYYYTIEDADLKAVEGTFDNEKNTIIANKEGVLPVTLHYLTTGGQAKTQELSLTFQYKADKAAIENISWTVTGEAGKNNVVYAAITSPSLDVIKANISGIESTLKYTAGKVTINGVKNLEYEDGITLSLVGLDKDSKEVTDLTSSSITKYVVKAVIDQTKVAAVSHTATVGFKNKKADAGLGNDILYRTDFTINIVQNNDALLKFTHATSYFDENGNAYAYGDVETAGIITYNLYSLYDATFNSTIEEKNGEKKGWITFSEVVPTKKENGKDVTADKWLSSPTSDAITVKPYPTYGGAYSDAREITVSYAPFGNSRLNAIVDVLHLSVQSAIKEGKFIYNGSYGNDSSEELLGKTKDKALRIDGGHPVSVFSENFTKNDAYGKEYEFDDNRITSVQVELANVAAKTYISLDTKDFTKTNKIVISRSNDNTPIVSKAECELNVIITDKWGTQSTVTIFVDVVKSVDGDNE